MTATMNKEERKLYESRPYKAYDAQGHAVYFRHLVDKRQAMELHGLTENPPGTPESDVPNPFKNYDERSTEAIRELCVARNVVGYMTMNKAGQIAALRELDKRDEAARKASRKPGAPAEGLGGGTGFVPAVLPPAEDPGELTGAAALGLTGPSLADLKAMADRVGVKYAPNISAAKLKARIEEAEAKAAKPGAPLEG